jgi:REP element-mobilizing transposase RayT
MQKQNPWMYSIHHVVSGGMWHITWILMVEEKLFFEDDKVN